MAKRPKIKLPGWIRHAVGIVKIHWLPLLYQVFLVGVLITIANTYAVYHQADLRGFLFRGTPLPSWVYVGDRSTAMLVEAFIAASVGVTIRWITLSLVASSSFTLSRYLRGWLADFVLAPFIVTILVIILRSPSLTFGDSTLSLITADIGTIWALAAIAGYFSLNTQSTFRKLRDKLWTDALSLDDVDPVVLLALGEPEDSQDGTVQSREANSDTEEREAIHKDSLPNGV